MSAIRKRRRRATWLALAGASVALLAAATLSVVGVQTLADSKLGRAAEGQGDELPLQRMPYTPTALVGTVDDTGRLTTVVVMAIEPDGTGGSIVQIAASADANSGNADVLLPLNAVLTVDGPDAFRLEAEVLTGLAFDVVEVIDERRFAQVIAPLGDLSVDMPIALYDASSGDEWEAGEIAMTGADAAQAVTAVDPMIHDWLFEPGRAAIWSAIADRVGAGIGSAAPVASDVDLPRPADLDAFLDRLYAGAVQYRALAIEPLSDDRVAEQLPAELGVAFGAAAVDAVSVHDRAEMLIVMGAVAPARVGAPLEAPNFRVVMGMTDAELEQAGFTTADVLTEAINRLLFMKVNVVSVAVLPGSEVPEHSTFTVVDDATIDGVLSSYKAVFGDNIVVVAAETAIEGIDIELVLGRDFVNEVAAARAADVEGSSSDDSSGESESESTSGASSESDG